MGPSLHAEIAIMVAILVGAWVLKVVAVAIYMICSKRRMERLQQRQTELPFTNGKPTPDHIITSLPVMSYANLLNQLGLGVLPTAAAAAQQPTQQQQFASALQAAMFAGCLNSSTTAPTSYPPQPQATPQTAPTAAPGLCNFGLLNPTQQGLKRGLSTSQSAGSLHTSSSCSDLPRQQSAQSTDKDCCPICFSDYEACSQVKQLPCRHYYHSECIDQWLVRDNTCPLCKNPVWTPPSSNKEPAAATAAAETTDAEALQREPAAALAPEGAVDEHLVDGQQPIEQQQSQQQLQQVVVVRDS